MSPTKFYKPKKAKKAKKAKNWVQEWAIAALYTDSDDDSVSTVDDFDDIISEMGEEVTLETDQEQDKMVSQVLRVLFESYEHYDIEKDCKGRNLQGLPDAPSDGDTELMVLMVIDHTTEYFKERRLLSPACWSILSNCTSTRRWWKCASILVSRRMATRLGSFGTSSNT